MGDSARITRPGDVPQRRSPARLKPPSTAETPMRYIFTYGLLSGLVIILTMIAGIVVARETFFSSAVFGYTVMLIAMTFIFVGVKRYRDVELGGVVRFGR